MKLRLLVLIPLLSLFQLADAQVFWSEDFDGTPCAAGSGCDPSIVSWTVVSTGAEGGDANRWFVSDTESGMLPPACGTAGQNDQSLHVGNVPTSTAAAIFCPTGDCGAAYDDSGPGEITNKRVESPVINCTGQANITVDFNYIENGAGSLDDASFWYFDGATWTNLDPIAKTPLGCAPQGQWTAIPSIALPASANGNPNVRIGFLWVNDGAGSASDPSFAVDDITLTNNTPGSITANFSASDSTLCEGDCINFTDLSTGTPNGWTWYFPGSATPTSNVQNPTNICYPTAGTYDVSLVATDGTVSDSLYMANFITVNNCNQPTAIFSADSLTICAGGDILFTDMSTGTGISAWSWTFNGGTPPTANTQGPHNVTFNTPGVYNIILQITDANGTDDTTITVTVNNCNTVNANFNASNTNICTGDSVVFTDASGGANQWNWDFDLTAIGGAAPGTTATQGPHTVFYTVPGVYTVQLIASDGTTSDTTTQQITVTTCTQPTAGINMNDGDGEICTNNCIDFSYNGGNGGTPTTIDWTFPGGTPSTYNSTNPAEVITVCWNDTTGTFNVGVTATNANGTSTANQTVVVHPEPIVNAGLDTSILIGQDASLGAIVTDTAGNPVTGGSFSWQPPFNLSCPLCQNTDVIQPLATGVYTVTYTDQYGCVVTDQVTVNVDIALNIGVPTAFSPNGDGTNDFLYVKGGVVIESMNFSIYNRYGQKVFETTDITEGWDGTHNGKELNPGVFVYYLNVVFIDGSTEELKGNTTLVK